MSVTPILQFGTSRFLQAHADLFISEALVRGEAMGGVTVVQSSGSPDRAHRLKALAAAGGFPVRIEGIERGVAVSRVVEVTSIHRTLDTATDWDEICRVAINEARIILSNTSEKGWVPQPEDAAAEFHQSMSYPAKLTHLLLACHRAGKSGLQVMPTELVAQNGAVLRARVMELAQALSGSFADWVATNVRFVNALVDRIVSEPLEPAGAVAEPYALWAIENCPGLLLPCRHPAIAVVDDLGPTERRKLYILNLGHTYLVSNWLDRNGPGDACVRDLMKDAAIRADLEDLYQREVLPVFAAAGDAGAADYAQTVLDRFANPYLAHRLSDIVQNHAQKLKLRIGAFLEWGDTVHGPVPAPRLREALASAVDPSPPARV